MSNLQTGSTCGGNLIVTTRDTAGMQMRLNEITGKLEFSKDNGVTWVQVGA